MENDTILIATNNLGKAREYANIFAELGLKIKTLADYTALPKINENGTTFTQNARIKAQTIATALNIPVLADDSGLIVDALNGEPGIYSARYAGDHDDVANNKKLLDNLKMVPEEQRTAHFHCSIVVIHPKKDELVATGDAYGVILKEKRGIDGFGYDPLFYYPELGKTFAELTATQKNKVSHRGIATQNLMNKFANWWED